MVNRVVDHVVKWFLALRSLIIGIIFFLSLRENNFKLLCGIHEIISLTMIESAYILFNDSEWPILSADIKSTDY